ncbi:hypothetical protein L596_007685 [Steinernema carpocapsae]|uniref:G-protein coupled receptors family 1 profile domain-containing protein n=1 Tax=Steinernema carpocapsae TaxID=34508 RepID=A0A4U5PAQ0_STECR|nr:hypothetical protein L596_007685 [Steinernema carpocapsae]
MYAVEQSVLASVFRLFIMVAAVFGNGLILFVVGRNRKLQQRGANLLFAQLAVADLLIGESFFLVSMSERFSAGVGVGVRATATIVFERLRIVVFHKGDCLSIGILTVFGIHLSQATMMSIAFDRFLCIQFPLFYRNSVGFPFVSAFQSRVPGNTPLLALPLSPLRRLLSPRFGLRLRRPRMGRRNQHLRLRKLDSALVHPLLEHVLDALHVLHLCSLYHNFHGLQNADPNDPLLDAALPLPDHHRRPRLLFLPVGRSELHHRHRKRRWHLSDDFRVSLAPRRYRKRPQRVHQHLHLRMEALGARIESPKHADEGIPPRPVLQVEAGRTKTFDDAFLHRKGHHRAEGFLVHTGLRIRICRSIEGWRKMI